MMELLACDDDIDGDKTTMTDDCDDTELNANVAANGCNDFDDCLFAKMVLEFWIIVTRFLTRGRLILMDKNGDVCDDDDDNDGVLDDLDEW